MKTIKDADGNPRLVKSERDDECIHSQPLSVECVECEIEALSADVE